MAETKRNVLSMQVVLLPQQVKCQNILLQWESKSVLNKIQAHELLFTDHIEQNSNPVYPIVNRVWVRQSEKECTEVKLRFCNASREIESPVWQFLFYYSDDAQNYDDGRIRRSKPNELRKVLKGSSKPRNYMTLKIGEKR